MLHFASDNWAGAHPAITKSLATHASGYSKPYSDDELDKAVERRFGEIFERDVAVFYVATGTAANSLALSLVGKPGGIVLAHREAHIVVDECGAPEFLSGQLRIATVDGAEGKIDPGRLRKKVESMDGDVHAGRANAISITQATEAGTVYSLEEIDAIAAIAKDFGLPLHMDGARFANALVSLKCTPAEMTWKRGIDMLSFGATKNGCWCAEAVVLFDKTKASDFPYIRKRAAQLFSKSRFISAQFDAYFRDALWLELAHIANTIAADIASAITQTKSGRLIRKPQSNEVFVVFPKSLVASLNEKDVVFYEWPTPANFEIAKDEQLCRFVASFHTTREDVAELSKLLEDWQGQK
ncbi:threonine aldolase [Periconia macrospinosa]|uniref:Threonine aldolase n=1 Tax=Periconia macrospinosa TaxID=97972 RepID=A0A2V1D834_9PLEO|nr:threonine aldolase [Periconia macrospinosa]